MAECVVTVYDENNNVIGSHKAKSSPRVNIGILVIVGTDSVTYGYKSWGRYEACHEEMVK